MSGAWSCKEVLFISYAGSPLPSNSATAMYHSFPMSPEDKLVRWFWVNGIWETESWFLLANSGFLINLACSVLTRAPSSSVKAPEGAIFRYPSGDDFTLRTHSAFVHRYGNEEVPGNKLFCLASTSVPIQEAI